LEESNYLDTSPVSAAIYARMLSGLSAYVSC
jgi:hypothetical protein